MPTPDATRLSGRERAVKLVGEFADRPAASSAPIGRDTPVLVFTGPRGIGRSALLASIAGLLDERVPFAKIDCATIGDRTVPEILTALIFELNRRVGDYRRLPFPRFIIGQLAIALTLDNKFPAVARGQLVAGMGEYEKVKQVRIFLKQLASLVSAIVPGPGNVPRVDAAGVIDLVFDGMLRRPFGQRAVFGNCYRWYGHQDRGLTKDPADVLVDLNQDAAKGLPQATELLCAAFLADLRHAFQDNRRARDWQYNAVVLVDNADSPAGIRLLDAVVRERGRQSALLNGHADPLTLVAASRGPLAALVAPPGGAIATVDTAGYRHYRERCEHYQRDAVDGDTAPALARWWYPVMLRNLTEDEVSNMVAERGLRDEAGDTANAPQIARALYRFTVGHPGSTRRVLDAIAAGRCATVDVNALLARQVRATLESPPVAVQESLLADFLGSMPESAVQDLITCSAARDIDAASRLATRSTLLVSTTAVRPLTFAAELWTSPGARRPAMLPVVLRTLLLRRLAARPDTDPANWDAVHSWLRDNGFTATTAGAPQPAPADSRVAVELYHAMALGGIDEVAVRLAESLQADDVHEWLALLTAVTAAPNRLGHELQPAERLGQLTAGADPHDLPGTPLVRLLVALWLLGDPLRDEHQQVLYLVIASGLDTIAPFSANGWAVLTNEAGKYRAAAALLA